MSETDSLRRIPQQARGAQRITKILDAADELFAEAGYEAATTNAIAARANTSIGSLYQFFPNKEAIFTALAQRYATELSNLYDKVLGTAVFSKSIGEVLDGIINGLIEIHDRHPGFRSVFLNVPNPHQLILPTDHLHQVVVQRVEELLAERAPHLAKSKRNLQSNVIINTVKALIPLTETGDQNYRKQVIEEIKIILLKYIEFVIMAKEEKPK